jgi:acyl-CoA synthetase (AMP-forming)/AMP-acid ligase II
MAAAVDQPGPDAGTFNGFESLPDLIRLHAAARPSAAAVADSRCRLDYSQLDQAMDRVAAAMQREGLQPHDAVAICAASSAAYVAVFLGALRAGAVVAPLAPSVTPASFRGMLDDCGARWLFADVMAAPLLVEPLPQASGAMRLIALDSGAAGPAATAFPGRAVPFADWLDGAVGRADSGHRPAAPVPVAIQPQWPFNIIYSSGTTGTPKGIVQPHGMRWVQANRLDYGYSPRSVSLLATPLYSNTTLVVLLPSLAHGGSVVLMEKFDATRYLELAQRHRATHTMLVPVQYQRLMALPEFSRYDLSSFATKFCTSAPFSASLKADVLARWPGGLIEFYGMTEGGGTCILLAHEHPGKLHTVGRPAPGHDIRLIDEEGGEVGPAMAGEVVGHSSSMMIGYHRQPQKTREAEWFDATGKRFIRTGDVGRFDEDGFLILLDRRKDVIISGGFNIYPSDLEAVLQSHPRISEAAVVAAPSERWGETPVGFVVLREAGSADPGSGRGIDDAADAILRWANLQLGRTQRLAALQVVPELPRSPIGKVLKRELRDRLRAGQSR